MARLLIGVLIALSVSHTFAQNDERERLAQERTEAVRAGKVLPATADDLSDIYDPYDGWEIAASPLVKPDREQYVISGKLVSVENDSMLLCQTYAARGEYVGNYFAVRISKKTKKEADILDRLRINWPIALVGRYTRNIKYQTVAAGMKVMPHFDADHIIIPNYADSGGH